MLKQSAPSWYLPIHSLMFFSFFYLQELAVFSAAQVKEHKAYPLLLFIFSSFNLHELIVTSPNLLNQSKIS